MFTARGFQTVCVRRLGSSGRLGLPVPQPGIRLCTLAMLKQARSLRAEAGCKDMFEFWYNQHTKCAVTVKCYHQLCHPVRCPGHKFEASTPSHGYHLVLTTCFLMSQAQTRTEYLAGGGGCWGLCILCSREWAMVCDKMLCHSNCGAFLCASSASLQGLTSEMLLPWWGCVCGASTC